MVGTSWCVSWAGLTEPSWGEFAAELHNQHCKHFCERVFSRPPGEEMLVFNSQVCDFLAAQDGKCFSILLHV